MAHKAVFFDLDAWGREYLIASDALKAAGVEVVFEDNVLNKDHIPTNLDFDIAGVFVDSRVDEGVINVMPNLKYIATLSTGFDHIDLKTCAAKGIVVSSVPAYGENTVAEFAFALILALSRKLREANRRVKEEGSFDLTGLRGFDLEGKTIGVVGTGRIGKHAIRMAKGFGMKVLANDAYPDEAFAKEMDFPYLPLPELLAQSDIITLHVPYIPETHHLINKSNVGLIKKGAYVINTARGGVIETAALVEALANGHLGGAGLDVLEEEGVLKNEAEYVTKGSAEMHNPRIALQGHTLIEMSNVIVTPHVAFNTREAFQRILDTTIQNIVNFTKGAPSNVVK